MTNMVAPTCWAKKCDVYYLLILKILWLFSTELATNVMITMNSFFFINYKIINTLCVPTLIKINHNCGLLFYHYCGDMLYLSHWTRTVENHYNDVIIGTMTSKITSLTSVYSTVYSGADQRKHQSSASLAFVCGIHRVPVNSPHKWPVTRETFPFDDVINITPHLFTRD